MKGNRSIEEVWMLQENSTAWNFNIEDFIFLDLEGPSLEEAWLTRSSLVLTIWGLASFLGAFTLFITNKRLHFSRRALMTMNLPLNFLLMSIFNHIPSLYYEFNRRSAWDNLGKAFCHLDILVATLTSFSLPWSLVSNSLETIVFVLSPEKYSKRIPLTVFLCLFFSPWTIASLITMSTVLHNMPAVGDIQFKTCTTSLTPSTWLRHDIIVMLFGFALPSIIILVLTALVMLYGRSTLQTIDAEVESTNSGKDYLVIVLFTTSLTNLFFTPQHCLIFFSWIGTYSLGEEGSLNYLDSSALAKARKAAHLLSHLFIVNLPMLWCVQQPELLLSVLSRIRTWCSKSPKTQEVGLLEMAT